MTEASALTAAEFAGLMDRLDSVTFGVLFLYVVGALHLGTAAVAAGFLNW